MLEPAAVGTPVLTGPSFYNFKDITNELISEQALIVCTSPTEISEQLISLIDNKLLSEEMVKSAMKVVQRNRGALSKTVNHIQEQLL